MRSEQLKKISKYRRNLEAVKEARRERVFNEMVDRFDGTVKSLTEAIQSSESKELDLTPVIEAIGNIKTDVTVTPEIKFNPEIKVEAPVVNVQVANDDIYARYKRFNSQTDPEGTYHGFADSDGNWFIQRESTMNSGKTDTTRFAVGKGNANQGWANRKTLKFRPISEVSIP